MTHLLRDPSEETLARILRLAGPRSAVPDSTMLRARQAARREWALQVRRRRLRRLAAAAGVGSLLVSTGLVLGGFLQGGAWPWSAGGDRSFSVAALSGGGLEIARGADGEDVEALALGMPVPFGTVVRTRDGRGALSLSKDLSLRLGPETRIRLASDRELLLERGSLYVDSADDRRSLTVETPWGVARDVGTQFELYLKEDLLRLRVREGRVEVESAKGPAAAEMGEELTVSEAGWTRRSVQTFGEPWREYLEVAPTFPLDGSSLEDYLRWLARETGWEITFSDPFLELAAAAVVLRGSLDGVPVEASYRLVLPTCGLEGTVVDGRLMVRRADEAGPGGEGGVP